MPTYEYKCNNGHHFEVEQCITDDPLETCTRCRAGAHRLISVTNFILKGGGWYSDGYSGNGKGSKSDSGSSQASNSKPDSDSKSDSSAAPASSSSESSKSSDSS